MGRVWRAHHTALKRDDALKVLPDAFAADPERLARLQREAQVLASLNHPNIAHVYGLEDIDGTKALVMELVEGPTLADRVARGLFLSRRHFESQIRLRRLSIRRHIGYHVELMTDVRQQVLEMFDRAVWIITAADGQVMSGLVATFVSNVSLVPALPRLAVGIAQHHFTWELIRRSRAFAAHLIDERGSALAWRFGLASGRDVNKLHALVWTAGRSGSPILADALGWLDCRLEAELDIGDRTIFVADVIDGGVNRYGTALTAGRLMSLADPDQRDRMALDRRRDEQIDAAAILAWRARRP
jgi:flavin reductase (DIM6/NTAB) family NADH-FMN oxidoreductase RutF